MEEAITKDLDLVVDYKGNQVPRELAQLIKGKWYLKNKDCAVHDGIWYPFGHSNLVFDHTHEKWLSKDSANYLIYGIINKTGEWGFFSEIHPNYILLASAQPFSNFKVTNGHQSAMRNCRLACPYGYNGVFALNEEVPTMLGYKESFLNGIFYKPSDLNDSQKNELFNRKGSPDVFKFKALYNVEDDKNLRDRVQAIWDKERVLLGKETSKFYRKYLSDFTYGVELEFSNGFLRNGWMHKHGLIGLRDGSVSNTGCEVATLPIRNARGLESLRDAMTVMNERCEVDNSCALHIHFGNTRKDKLYILALWKTLSLIQEELFQLFPYERQAGNNEKQYCQKLPDLGINYSLLNTDKDNYSKNLKSSFDSVYAFLNKYPTGHLRETRKVLIPVGENKYKMKLKQIHYSVKNKLHYQNGQPKWKVNSRYYFMSLYNLFFREQETIEARIHEGTLSFDKTFNWLCTVVAILKYAENCRHVLSLKDLKLKDIISSYYDEKTSKIFNAYWETRRSSLYNAGDKSWRKSSPWMKADKNFKNSELII